MEGDLVPWLGVTRSSRAAALVLESYACRTADAVSDSMKLAAIRSSARGESCSVSQRTSSRFRPGMTCASASIASAGGSLIRRFFRSATATGASGRFLRTGLLHTACRRRLRGKAAAGAVQLRNLRKRPSRSLCKG